MSKYFDFDEFMGEQEQEKITIKVFGKEYDLPASPPASLVLKIMRLQNSGSQNASSEQVEEMAFGLFGKENMDELLGKGLTLKQLEVLITNVSKMYFEKNNINDAAEEKADKKK